MHALLQCLGYFMRVSVLPAGMHVLDVHGGQKRASDPLELETQTVVSCHLRAGNQSWKGNLCSSLFPAKPSYLHLCCSLILLCLQNLQAACKVRAHCTPASGRRVSRRERKGNTQNLFKSVIHDYRRNGQVNFKQLHLHSLIPSVLDYGQSV